MNPIIEVNDRELIDLVKSGDHKEIAKFIGRQNCDFTAEDEKYIDLFWDVAFNSSWIYVTEDMVSEQFGYKKNTQMMSEFYKKLINHFEDKIDYLRVEKNHELVVLHLDSNRGKQNTSNRGGSLKKYYLITGETYKHLLLMASTKQAKITRKYFIKIEKLASLTNQIIFRCIETIKNIEIADQKKRIDRLYEVNSELLSYKKLTEKNEYIYLISTYNYVTKGLIKIGRTKNIKSRTSDHNTSHPTGDKIKILRSFRVNDSAMIETIIHKKLAGIRPDRNSEFFLCPYHLLVNIVELVIQLDDRENDAVNTLIENVYKIKQNGFNEDEWITDLDMSIFSEKMVLIENPEERSVVRAEFDIANATKEQKNAFVKECIIAYNNNIAVPNNMTSIVWTVFQTHLMQQLNIPKSRFKAQDWRDAFIDVAKKESIAIRLRK